MLKGLAQTQPNLTVPTLAPSVVILHVECLAAPKTELSLVLYTHMTPYIAEGWGPALHDSNISHLFPLLVNDVAYGSPIGNPLPL